MKTALVEFLSPLWIITQSGLDRLTPAQQSFCVFLPPICPYLTNPGSTDQSFNYIALYLVEEKIARRGLHDYGDPENFLLSEINTDEEGYVISLKIHSAVVEQDVIEEMSETDPRWVESVKIYNQMAADEVLKFTVLD
jgi:hypothetical protein